MNPEDLVKELVHQNKLLKETIPFLLTATTLNNDYRILNAGEETSRLSSWSESSERDGSETDSCILQVLSSPNVSSPNSPSTTPTTSISNHSSIPNQNQQQQTTASYIETLLDLLDRQESRLDLLEKFGKSVLLQSNNIHHIPIFRGLEKKKKSITATSTTETTTTTVETETDEVSKEKCQEEEEEGTEEGEGEVGIKEWTRQIQEHIRKIKSFNSTTTKYETKEIIRLIYDKLDLEPLDFLTSILKKNQALIYIRFPSEVPPVARSSSGDMNVVQNTCFDAVINSNSNSNTSVDFLFQFPFKLYLLRHPKALLNLLNSKF